MADQTTKGGVLDPKEVRKVLDHHHHELRDQIFEFYKKNPVFDLRKDLGLSMKEKRALTFERCLKLAESRIINVDNLVNDGWRNQAILEALAYHDAALQVRYGVHSGLFGGSILRMGTEKHRKKYLEDMNSYRVRGVFAMTELGHGSNVQQLLTTATFDKQTDEFVLHTPNDLAQKFWIGGLAEYGNTAIVFAQLYIDGKHYGVHPFVVPIRDIDTGKVLPGITIADVGPKQGLDGVDNGRMWLNQVRIPRDNLLNRFNDVGRDGTYTSPLASHGERFLANMAALLGARANVGISSVNVAKIGVTITTKYGLTRRQFGGGKGVEETLLLDYFSHQKRLFPLLATIYALNFFGIEVKRYLIDNINNVHDQKLSHTYGNSIKVYGSQFMNETLQICRELCGGQGFSAYNRIGILRADWDLHVTVDGANYVLYQQIAKGALDSVRDSFDRDAAMTSVEKQIAALKSHKDFRSPAFWKALLALRQDLRLVQLTDALGAAVGNGVLPKDAWDQSMDFVWGLSEAYTENLVLNMFAKAVEEEQKKKSLMGHVFGLLFSLFGLRCWDRDGAWFAKYSGLSVQDQEAIVAQYVPLCAEIRPHALQLVDGFGIPDHLLSPIAGDWVSFYARSKL